MVTSFKLNTSELNIDFVESIKKLFFNKEIEILIRPSTGNNDFSFSEELNNAINNIENGENLKKFTMAEFEQFSKSL